ncbi:alpha/beta fold hydrolase [Pseudooceanicola atlanticus]|nr:alpha/beta hydrolase [Pseudooceanicola atlanticus]
MEIDLPMGKIHAAIRGEGAPILIMHGGGLDHRHMLDALEPAFKNSSGWRRVYMDLPGHGKSIAHDSVEGQDDVLSMISAFIDAAFDREKFAVIGESRGSYHAMGLAHTRPDDILGMMLIVADGMPGSSADWRPEHRTLVTMPDAESSQASPEAAARLSRLVVQRPDVLQKIERTKVPASALVDGRLAEKVRDNFNFSFDLADPTRVFDKPCLVVNGRQDAMAGYQDMLDGIERYPRATLAVLDCAGHSLSWEQPELFKALTVNWLQRMSL